MDRILTVCLSFLLCCTAVFSECLPNYEEVGLQFGFVECTNSTNVGSVCVFRCTGEYQIAGDSQLLCMEVNSFVAEWNHSSPACYEKCTDRVDVALVIDSSSSVGASRFAILRDFISSVISQFQVGPTCTQFAAIRYNTRIYPLWNLNSFSTTDSLVEAVENIPYNGRGTYTGAALNYTHEFIFNEESGRRPGVGKIVVVLTDGRSADDISIPSQLLKSDNSLIVVIGIGGVPKQHANEIASDPDSDFITYVPSFASLETIINNVTSQIRLCQGIPIRSQSGVKTCDTRPTLSPTWSQWGEYRECSRTCGGGITSRTRICLNSNGDGSGCSGPTISTRVCNTSPCSKCSPDYEEVGLEFGFVECTNSTNVGSACAFRCREGYQIAGNLQLLCMEVNSSAAEWSHSSPACYEKCTDRVDVALVIDSSSSVGASRFAILRDFISSVISQFQVGPTCTQFAAIRYNSGIYPLWNLNSFSTTESLVEAVQNIAYDGRMIYTGAALNYTREFIFNEESGRRPGVGKIAVVLTDGRSLDDVSFPSRLLKSDNTLIVVVGIGADIVKEANEIASNRNFVTLVSNLDSLEATISNVTSQIRLCHGNLIRSQPSDESCGPKATPFPAWTQWGEYDKCSRRCGGGLATRRRICLNSNGDERGCSGPASSTQFCNTLPCSSTIYWECKEVRAFQRDCEERRNGQQCGQSQDRCRLTAKDGEGEAYIFVEKSCKTLKICSNYYVQNKLAPTVIREEPAQNTVDSMSSVCTCCCGNNTCLKNCSSCPVLGYLHTCDFPSPHCDALICAHIQTAPNFGEVSCTDNNFVGSICSFRCDPGYSLHGSSLTTCADNEDGDIYAVWDMLPPVCLRTQCFPPHLVLENGSVECTDANIYGSTCSFRCDYGYSLHGSGSTTCIDNEDGGFYGVWHSVPPTCVQIQCFPPHVDLENGSVECTDENIFRSICSFRCDPGYSLHGSSSTTCVDDEDGSFYGVWHLVPPVCIQQSQCLPPPVNPLNGSVRCTDENIVGSTCRFTCDSGYFLRGSISITCVDDADGDVHGVWTFAAPVCIQIRCYPLPEDPENGSVQCTEENIFGSICSYSCNDGYSLSSVSSSECQDQFNGDAIGNWTNPQPLCQRIIS